MNQQKFQFAQKTQDLATQAATIMAQLAEIVAVWDDRQYGPGATNELKVVDLLPNEADPLTQPLPVTPNDLYAMVIAASQIGQFIESQPTAVPGPYSATFNKLRRDM